jgi:hypothetical protein
MPARKAAMLSSIEIAKIKAELENLENALRGCYDGSAALWVRRPGLPK